MLETSSGSSLGIFDSLRKFSLHMGDARPSDNLRTIAKISENLRKLVSVELSISLVRYRVELSKNRMYYNLFESSYECK